MKRNERPRLLLVNPPSCSLVYRKPGRAGMARVHPSLGLASIASAARSRADVRILDLNVERNGDRALAETLRSFKPTHTGVTGTTPMFPEMLRILAAVRDFDGSITTIAGGPHVSALPEEAAAENVVDVAVIGEGEKTIGDLLEKNVEDTNGICFGSEGMVVRTPDRPLMEDLDGLPLPAWDLFDLSRYHAPVMVERRRPAALIETSRGCPHRCTFCCRAPFGTRWRVKSPERVVEDFLHAREAGFREIHIEDDGFAEDPDRAKEVCRALETAGSLMPWNLLNGIRVDKFDHELARALKKAGCYQAGFGLETGSDRILGSVRKDVESRERARDAIETARQAGLETVGYFILGLPEETPEDLEATIEFARSLPLDFAKFALFVPFPGSEEFERLQESGNLSRDWGSFLFHDAAKEVFAHPRLAREEKERYYRRAYRRFYLRAEYILKRLMKGFEQGIVLEMFRSFIRTKW